MLIVSQDEFVTVNNENIEALGIAESKQKNNKEHAIVANTISKERYLLGVYKDEKRAKEVLQEIVEFYETSKRYECSSNNGLTIFIKNTFTYEMPKE